MSGAPADTSTGTRALCREISGAQTETMQRPVGTFAGRRSTIPAPAPHFRQDGPSIGPFEDQDDGVGEVVP